MNVSYTNPVYPRPFADPFVLKYCGEYWAYCTGTWRDGRWFGVLRSRDLVAWEEVGGAMEPLPGHWPCQWAPEVSSFGGRLFLYYSLGDEATMHIRVAVADHPAGPFHDSGHRLTGEPFAIDPHVFADDDGARYLFYATDYLEHSHVGTGTARDRLIDPFTLAGQPTPVTRARHPWQIYDPSRAEKGGVRWHTLEGPFVLKRKGRYYQMFSGGNWQNLSYGVSYAVADGPDGSEEWAQVADGEAVPPILRTVPGQVIGPGHNSVVRGPDNRELYCVYHSWNADGSGRSMAIDPLDWAGERLLVLGPSVAERPLALPTYADFFTGPGLGSLWAHRGGAWSALGGAAVQPVFVPAQASFTRTPPAYLAEVSVVALDSTAAGGYGLALGSTAQFLIEPARSRALARVRRGGTWEERPVPLPPDFVPQAYQLLRVEVNAGRASVTLGEGTLPCVADLPCDSGPLAMVTAGAPAAFAGFALTEGWQDRFERPGAIGDLGWVCRHQTAAAAPASWQLADGALRATARPEGALVLKGPLPAAYELVVNFALPAATPPGGIATVYPAARAADLGPAITLRAEQAGFALSCASGAEQLALPLPPGFDGATPHQLRVRASGGTLQISLEGRPLGEVAAPAGATHVGLAAQGAAAVFEMVRVTALHAAQPPSAAHGAL